MIKLPKQVVGVKRAARWMGTGFSVLLILAAVALLLAVVPVFGNKALIVRSGSMTPAIGVGDLVVVRPDREAYEAGQVLAFKSANNSDVIVTHRVSEVLREGDSVSYVTKGDANEQADESVVTADRVLGRQVFTVPYVGNALAFGKTKFGFVSFIIIPALLIMAGDVRVIWRELRGRHRKEKRGVAADVVKPELPEEVMRPVFAVRRSVSRRVPARVYLDSVVAKVVLLVVSVGLTIPSGLALYADSETSTDNLFAAAACFETDPYIDEVTDVDGTYGHCCNAGDLASDTATAQALVTGPMDSPPANDYIQISDDTVVTTKFVNNKALPSGDNAGDVRVHTVSTVFASEAEILVSENCTDFVSLGTFADNDPALFVDVDIDPAGLSFVKCMKFIDQDLPGETFGVLGFDLDAAEALNSEFDCEATL